MTNANVIEGLTILQKYYEEKPGYNIGADHDVIYACNTTRPVEESDVQRLVELGWFQRHAEYDEEFTASNYDPECSWWAFT